LKEIIILGGSGYVGNALISKLKIQKIKIRAMIHKKQINHTVKTFQGDITNLKSLEKNLHSNNIVVNLIGQIKNDQSTLYQENIGGSINLLESCVKKKIKNIIFISTINVYGNNIKKSSKESDVTNPETYYATIKLLTEQLYRYYSIKYKMNITILRLSNVYGPKKSLGLIGKLIKCSVSNTSCTLNHNGNQLRDFIFIDDVVNAIIKVIIKNKKGFSIFNISQGKRYKINDVVDIIQHMTNKKIKIKKSSDKPDEKCLWANNLKAKKELNFIPKISLKRGLSLTFKSIKTVETIN
jgi:nucleoside-diphosphate-sugar epimerase